MKQYLIKIESKEVEDPMEAVCVCIVNGEEFIITEPNLEEAIPKYIKVLLEARS